MASGRETSRSIKHPVLGPADTISDDRNKSLGSLFLNLAFVCLGPVGVFQGLGDLAGATSDSHVLGIAYVAGGVALCLYGLWHVYLAFQRLRNPVALVVGRDGFESPSSGGPVRWDEVDTISDPASPPGEPRMLRVQLADPDDFAGRHSIGPIGRYLLRARQGDLFLGRDMAMPVPDIQALMRKRLAEFGRLRHDDAPASGAASRSKSGGRRPGKR